MKNLFIAILLLASTFSQSLAASLTQADSPIILSPYEQYQIKQRFMPNADISAYIAEYMAVIDNVYKASNGDLGKILEAVNAYTKAKHPEVALTTMDELNKKYADYSFYAEGNSAALYFTLLEKDKKITANEAEYLKKLDAIVSKAATIPIGFDALKKAQTELAQTTLNKEEKAKIGNYLDAMVGMYSYFASRYNQNACFNCLNSNLWQILTGSAFAYSFCVFLTGGTGFLPCVISLVLGGAVMAYSLCPECYGVACEVCPSGFKYDGMNCASGICAPQGTTAFIYRGVYYYTALQPGNQCPIGQAYDGANCYKMPVPAGYEYRAFVYQNCFYTFPRCR
jgi:hypothetical protein